jgi:preprotein translocase subunit SecE
MAIVKEKNGRSMATDVVVREDQEPGDKQPSAQPTRAVSSGGFFSIYKKGQGYWTRMGTAGASLLIVALIVYNFFQYLPALFGMQRGQVIVVSIIFAIIVSLFAFWVMNRPTNAEFLIATDSEMKKVNWTSKQELIGSTKVVVIFMFLIAILLFAVDLVFQTFFWLINVLRIEPFYVPYLRDWSGHIRHWLGW